MNNKAISYMTVGDAQTYLIDAYEAKSNSKSSNLDVELVAANVDVFINAIHRLQRSHTSSWNHAFEAFLRVNGMSQEKFSEYSKADQLKWQAELQAAESRQGTLGIK